MKEKSGGGKEGGKKKGRIKGKRISSIPALNSKS